MPPLVWQEAELRRWCQRWGGAVNTDEAPPCLSTARFLLCGPAPSRLWAGTGWWPGSGDPNLSCRATVSLAEWPAHRERLRRTFWSSSSRVLGACKKHLQRLLRKGGPKAPLPTGPGWGPGNWLLVQLPGAREWGKCWLPDHPRRTLSQSRAVFQIRTEGSVLGVASDPGLHLIISNFHY